jgi:hypothetical protein
MNIAYTEFHSCIRRGQSECTKLQVFAIEVVREDVQVRGQSPEVRPVGNGDLDIPMQTVITPPGPRSLRSLNNPNESSIPEEHMNWIETYVNPQSVLLVMTTQGADLGGLDNLIVRVRSLDIHDSNLLIRVKNRNNVDVAMGVGAS